ncbi:MAG TPA: DUF2066 domain-containing protein [Pseudomonadales bacterium]|nr:DUF2066 domain-containing protein [Pseudomonadales bacterium]
MGRFARVFRCIFWALTALSINANATPVDWLYDVDVPVTDQSSDARAAGFRQALTIVLKRVSGLNEIPPNAAVSAALESPQRYFVEYRYRSVDNPVPGASPPKVLQLSVHFVDSAIQKLITEASLPQWSANRPTTLAWIVVVNGSERSVLGAGDASPLLASMREHARERGLPLLFPTMDLEEQSAVTAATVTSSNETVLETASQHYGADQMLVGRATLGANDAWTADWQVWQHGNQQRFVIESPTSEAAGAAVVDRMIELLVARYVVASGNQERIRLRVDGVANVGDYGALLKYLGGLDFIGGLQVEEVRANVVDLSITTRTPWDRLRDLLALDGRLVPAEQIAGGPGTDRRVLTWHGERAR